ncbi:MAG TPA: TonB-dependent receptor [Cyclobacteriaceae bacterium]|nr:TonB-dependent receptor [Cyclobacteriaceae bacterium]
MVRFKWFIISWLFPCLSHAQGLTQTVRGNVTEKESHYPLTNATVLLLTDTTRLIGTITDLDGNFKLVNVPIGRHKIKVSFIGYYDYLLSNVEVSSSREVVLHIALEESASTLSDVIVRVTNDGTVANDMAVVSAQSFTVDETQRYPGSRGDPARMASNFAGVQGADDSRNDIVIRGNSPQALLWRMEGINIPNPNHFNIPGTAGGPVSMINNKTLANSDFFTGAFPAEFGNSISGSFDLRLRSGNKDKHEVSGQLGFLGTEFFAEGPLSKNHKSSYLFSYRYSTLAMFNTLGIDIGTNSIPYYQDISFKFSFPLKNKGEISFFGMGGKSDVDILISQQKEPDRNIYGDNDRDQYFKSKSGVAGVAYKQPIDASSFLSATIAVSGESVSAHDDYVYRHLDANNQFKLDSLQSMLDYTFSQTKISGYFIYSKKKQKAGTFSAGLSADEYFFQFKDSVRNIDTTSPDYYSWRRRWDSRGSSLLLQPFIQWKYNLSQRSDLLIGLHSQYFSMTNSFILAEPRIGYKLKLNHRQTISAGIGLHSQIQPTYLYFYGQTNDGKGNPVPQNLNVDFTRSAHYVFGYEKFLGEDFRVKAEVYYQDLYTVPVEKSSSSFSLLNTGAGFSRFFPGALVNTGIGKNFGAELTLEKFFSNGYLFLVTTSLFESKYQGSDRIWRDTDFNGNYIFNALFSKEWQFANRNTFSLGSKVTTAGGKRYGPVDMTASDKQKEVVYVDATRNSLQFEPYFRTDLKINYKINRPRVSHEFSIDLINIFDTKNILKLTYAPVPGDPTSNPIREEYQLGFLPLFYYRIDF